MYAYHLTSFGADVARVETEAVAPADGQVLVRMHAASINYRDYMIAQGFYNPNLALPLIPLSDGAGEVVAVGEGVTGVGPGDRVASVFWPQWQAGRASWATRSASTGCELPGVLAQHAVMDQGGVIAIPDYLSFSEAATLPCAALTAYSGLTAGAGTGPGDTVLIQGTGGVALFGLQFAKALGAQVALISSSDEKLETAVALGADVTLNYKDEPAWGAKIAEQTGGVNTVLEIGGAGTLEQSLAALALDGDVSLIGALTGMSKELNLMGIVGKNAHLHGITVGHRADFQAMLELMAANDIHPVISHIYGFDQAPAALKDIAAGQHFGKLVVEIG
jgi:NADPH:quinone reductase-like Zn-dependent oxidoreductase